MWDLSCIDWEDRIREGRSLIPDLPLLADEADMAVSFYDELQLPDVPGTPKIRTASGQWFRDPRLVRLLGSGQSRPLHPRHLRAGAERFIKDDKFRRAYDRCDAE